MKIKNVLVLTRYDFIGPSSRLRFIQYFKFLENTGLKIIHSPLFNDKYLKRSFNNKSIFNQVFKGYVNRFFKLLTLSKYDISLGRKRAFSIFTIFC